MLVRTLINRVVPAYTARVTFSARRDIHDLSAAMREADMIDKRDAMRTMFINHSCSIELADQWFAAATTGECTHDFTF
jgi:hypothetical protein